MKKRSIITSVVLAGTLLLGACSSGTDTTTSAGTTSAGTTSAGSTSAGSTTAGTTTTETTVVKVGVFGSKHELWDKIQENLRAENIEIELIEFTDYNTPNRALADGDIDLNSFQHHKFFDDFNEANNTDLLAIGDTFLSPIGLYSDKYESPTEIQEGDQVAIPDDPTNLGRALKVLEAAGLITLKDPANLAPTLEDITGNPKNLEIIEMDAAQIPRNLQDVGAAIINTDIAVDAGFSPANDAIFLEPVTDASHPYYNLIAARSEDKDNPVYNRIVSEYQTQEIGELMLEVYDGAQFPVWEGFVNPNE